MMPNNVTRRDFLAAAGAAVTTVTLSSGAVPIFRNLKGPIRFGLITDLHQDLMHDGESRLDAFLAWSESVDTDCIMQLGDFAYPKEGNRAVIDKFNKAKGLHVIGNHDMDAGHTNEQCVNVWGMSHRYYAHDVKGLRVLVLDGNDKGSPTHKGGYAAYVGKEQQEWLQEQLTGHDGPFLIASHQSLSGPWAVDNAIEIQAILSKHADKIAMCINGHDHIDLLQRVGGVCYLHVNSASYQWVGGAHKHNSYPAEIHADHPWIGHTCPYRDSVFAGLTFDPESGTITIEGRTSTWVGPSPAELGVDTHADLANGEEIAPRIRSRHIEKVRS
ncbi:MAG: metallophosphoesterase family protein [Planctomycetota bacterium]|nr:metallophosphoesterase family protein [Planctomycetota bacterium]